MIGLGRIRKKEEEYVRSCSNWETGHIRNLHEEVKEQCTARVIVTVKQ